METLETVLTVENMTDEDLYDMANVFVKLDSDALKYEKKISFPFAKKREVMKDVLGNSGQCLKVIFNLKRYGGSILT